MIVLIADAAQNGFGKDYTSVTEAIVLVITIVGWDYLIDWLAWRFERLRPWLKVPALTLIEHGKLIDENLRREMISRDDLAGQLRANGVRAAAEVELARLEEDGRVSVIKHGSERSSSERRPGGALSTTWSDRGMPSVGPSAGLIVFHAVGRAIAIAIYTAFWARHRGRCRPVSPTPLLAPGL